MNKVVMVVLTVAVAALIAATILLLVRVQALEADAKTMQKRTAEDEEIQRIQHDSMIKISHSADEAIFELRGRIETAETWISARSRTETHSTTVVVRQAPAPAPTPRANWWCYLGRECFRTMRQCSNDVDERATNCKPFDAAFCNHVGGCFGDMMACIETLDVVSTCTRSE